MLITRLCKIFNENSLKYAIAGGFAVALHGAVRGTIDVDIVLDLNEKNLTLCESILKSMGFVSKIPIDPAILLKNREMLMQEKNLIAWSFYNPKDPSEVIDILIHKDLADIDSTVMRYADIELSVIAKHDLIAMKKESGRPQDLEDVKALESI
ncbi:MAG TPA: hypothetical protein PK079_18480 [Leptospiraceae bacterium]|nr:hypothetical protein [Leptospiraceae bacterium]HMW07772.1 hypothetical protein [Leptospiraceae bacterium]HMX34943.1 hypothetical protein [Leptospiraceae bacterium]HMY34285.1 hypothetical protein [Leptospiraceae bacterium]HMZ64085.1 hypothetical protein [Leptospiraceae bacterium]